MKNLDALKQHGDVIWNIANLLRGPYRPPQYRRVMIPLTVLRRLDCVLESTKDQVIAYHKKLKAEGKHDADVIETMVNHKFKLNFHNTSEFTFQKLLGDADKLAANLANYMAGFSSRARKIIEKFKFDEEIEKLEDANRLFDVIKQVAAVDLHPDTIPNIAMGYLFEDLVRRFNEQANEEAGDHFTPREVIKLMVNILFTHDDLVYQKGKVKVQLINGTDFAWKMKKSLGNKRKRIGDGLDGTPNHIAVLTRLYGDFKNDVRQTVAEIQTNVDAKRDQNKALAVSKIFDNQDFGFLKITVERPLRLNFCVTADRIARFKTTNAFLELAISRKRKNKAKIEEEILVGAAAQNAMLGVLASLSGAFNAGQLVKDRAVFEKQLAAAFKKADITLEAKLKDALLAPGSLGEKDPKAEICWNKKGESEPDADLRDTENVPLPPGITLPLPLDYEGKKNKGKVDVAPLLELVESHCEAYLTAEVLPYRADAWIDHSKTKVGYEIPFNRHFYEYVAPRPLDEIAADITALEQDIMAMLKDVTA